jgi:hypothetical protein
MPGEVCTKSLSSPQSTSNFNEVEFAYGQILRTLGQDDWTFPMYFNMRAYHPMIWIYYMAIIFFCGYFGFNLLIAVLKTNYSNVTTKYDEESLERRK